MSTKLCNFFVRPLPTWINSRDLQTLISQTFPSASLRCYPPTKEYALHRGIGQLTIQQSEVTAAQFRKSNNPNGCPIDIGTYHPVHLHPYKHKNTSNSLPVTQFQTPQRHHQQKHNSCPSLSQVSLPKQIQQISSVLKQIHQQLKELARQFNNHQPPRKTQHQSQQYQHQVRQCQQRKDPFKVHETEIQASPKLKPQLARRLRSKRAQVQIWIEETKLAQHQSEIPD